ncbi:MAG: NAD(P)-dependent oxidoreductase, partial [Chloroflexi bacterium]
MRILLAGASGVIGTPLVMRLHAAGHDVLALHRAPEGAARMRAMGATPIRVDVLDRRALLQALDGVAVDAVISELTALKKPPITHGRMKVTDRLRTEGTANLLAAARATGAHRFLTQSMIFGYGYGDSGERGDQFLTERDPFGMGG